jgi:hypothetical protein
LRTGRRLCVDDVAVDRHRDTAIRNAVNDEAVRSGSAVGQDPPLLA